MKQKLSFDSTTDISIEDAKKAAQDEFPGMNFSNVVDKIELERILNEAGEILFVEVDQDDQINLALENERILSAQIASRAGTMECDVDPPPFSTKELDADLWTSHLNFQIQFSLTTMILLNLKLSFKRFWMNSTDL